MNLRRTRIYLDTRCPGVGGPVSLTRWQEDGDWVWGPDEDGRIHRISKAVIIRMEEEPSGQPPDPTTRPISDLNASPIRTERI